MDQKKRNFSSGVGYPAEAAQRFGVSEATISRDLRGILGPGVDPKRCLFCHSLPLDNAGLEAVEDANIHLQAHFGQCEPWTGW